MCNASCLSPSTIKEKNSIFEDQDIIFDLFFLPGLVVHTFSPGTQRQVGPYEFEASLVYIASIRLAKAI